MSDPKAWHWLVLIALAIAGGLAAGACPGGHP